MTSTGLLTLMSFVAVTPSAERAVTFERDVVPLLTRTGCNSGACHGKARGQNGFALSLLGFDSTFDFNAIVHEARGRRLFPANPAESLLLLKASGSVPHGGGAKLPVGSPGYETLLKWVSTGTPRTPAEAPKLARITVAPVELVATFTQSSPLTVTAHYSDGSAEDVTKLAAFQSNDSGYAAVDANGVVRVGTLSGEAAVTARFADKFAVCQVLVPLPGKVEPSPSLAGGHVVDRHVSDKLVRLGLTASERAGEGTLHRRTYLMLIGRLPTPDETTAYIADTDHKKHERLVDTLLARPEYADFWANKWADLLRPNPYHVGIKATFNFDSWIREQFRQNVPYDQFVRSLITSQGSTFQHGATVFYRNRRIPEELAPMVSQLFLGVRLDCAKCHQHPSEKWGQQDFYRSPRTSAGSGVQGHGHLVADLGQ